MIYGYRDRVRSIVISRVIEQDIRYINSDFFHKIFEQQLILKKQKYFIYRVIQNNLMPLKYDLLERILRLFFLLKNFVQSLIFSPDSQFYCTIFDLLKCIKLLLQFFYTIFNNIITV